MNRQMKNLNSPLQADEHCACNRLITFDNMTLLHAHGDNTSNFLQGQFTCDMRQLSPHQTTLGAYCNNKGRVLGLMRLIPYNNGFLLWLPTSISEQVATRLQKVAVFSQVKIDALHLTQVGIIGANAETLLASITPLPSEDNYFVDLNDQLIIRCKGVFPRYLILNANNDLLVTLRKQFTTGQHQHWLTEDILIDLPHLHPNTIDKFMPQMLNLKTHNALSFSKGCYVGQEIIARTEHLGKLKRKLYRSVISHDLPLPPGQALLDNSGAEIGHVINSTAVSTTQHLLNAVIKISAVENNTVFFEQQQITIAEV